ncbi:MAG: ABC transporter permease [Anaerolineales bacterium]|nr:ABC transporter permease [Anaerolineales bacterium]
MTFFPWKRALRSKRAWFSALTILGLGLVAGLAPWLAPHDPFRLNPSQASRPPMWVRTALSAGQPEYPLGTDRYGRDVLSRLLYGTRTAFCLALTAVPLAAALGTLAGLVAGYAGGRLAAALMALIDLLQTLPSLMFLVICVLIMRGQLAPTWFNGLLTLVVGFAAVNWTSLARLIRVAVLRLKTQLFVEAARSVGASAGFILLRHILPNVLHLSLAWIINNIPAVILLEAVLGYIGVGVTTAVDGDEFLVISWGGLFYAGRSALSRNPFMLILPAAGLLLLSLSFILLADFLNGLSRPEPD